MLENLAYCLNATAPIFLLMLLGLVFRRLGFFSQAFADKLNDFVFKVGLPVMLFKDLVESDFFTVWDGPFVLFCFLATLGSILLTAALSLFCRERPLRATAAASLCLGPPFWRISTAPLGRPAW